MSKLHSFKNNAIGLIQNNPLAIGGTNLIVDNTLDGKLLSLGFPFYLTLWSAALTPDTDSNVEIVEVSARVSPNNYTIVRAKQSTSAHQWAQYDNVALLFTASNFSEAIDTSVAVTKGMLVVYGSDGLPHLITAGADGTVLGFDSTQTYGVNTFIVATASNIQNQTYNYYADSGSANTYVITPSPAISSYTAGQKFAIKIGNANSGASTLNVNGLGTKTIKKSVSSDLSSGDLSVGQIVEMTYDGTNFQINISSSSQNYPSAQVFPAGSSWVASSTQSNFTCVQTGLNNGGDFYGIINVPTSSSGVLTIQKYSVTPQGSIYVSTNLGVSIGNGSNNLAIAGSYIYLNTELSSNAGITFQRFNLGTLASQTTMTISGSSYMGPMFSDGTNLYVVRSAGTVRKYTISGTTLTDAGDISFTNISTSYSVWCDGTNVYQINTGGTSYKWAIAGGASTTITGYDFSRGTTITGMANIPIGAGSNKVMAAICINRETTTSTTSQTQCYGNINFIPYQ